MPNTAFILKDAGFTRDQIDALTVYWEGSVSTKEDIAHLNGKIDTSVMELRSEMKELRSEMKEFRSEMKADIAHLDGKIDTSVMELRSEMKADIAHLDGKIDTSVMELRTELKYIKWIGAAILAGILIPLIKDLMV